MIIAQFLIYWEKRFLFRLLFSNLLNSSFTPGNNEEIIMIDTILKTTQEKWLSCVLVFCYHTCPILTRKSYQSFLFPCDRFKIVALVEVRTAEAEESHWHVSTWGWQISWFSSLTEIQKTWVFCKIWAESKKWDSRISLSHALAGECGEYPLK